MMHTTDSAANPVQAKCTKKLTRRMKSADCSDLKLVSIPYLTSDIEVLDASTNRIRKLKNDSFVHLTSLKFLYLSDNAITSIEAGAFSPLQDLEALDLTLNAIRDLPPLLPTSLRRLYLSENPLQTVPLQNAVSLEYVSLANCELNSLPYLGILPQLLQINLTGNAIESLFVEQLAAFCHLETLEIPTSLLNSKYTSSCECVRVHSWAINNSIYMIPLLNCSVANETECFTNTSSLVNEAFSSCQLAYQQIATSRWIISIIGAVVVLLLVIVLVLLWRRKLSRSRAPVPQPSQEEVRKRQLLKKSTRLKF
ncbi:biglycan isoform X2 [Cimex lectularius]|nr:biglycan isoform X2 [Cimex lectularius]